MLTLQEAYAAVVRHLEQYSGRTQAENVGAPLSDLQTDGNGEPLDPAAWPDWMEPIIWVEQRPVP